MNQSNINKRNIKEGITMADFQEGMKRFAPGLKKQGLAISKRAGIHPNTLTRAKAGLGHTTAKGQHTLFKILKAAKDIYKELLAEVDT